LSHQDNKNAGFYDDSDDDDDEDEVRHQDFTFEGSYIHSTVEEDSISELCCGEKSLKEAGRIAILARPLLWRFPEF